MTVPEICILLAIIGYSGAILEISSGAVTFLGEAKAEVAARFSGLIGFEGNSCRGVIAVVDGAGTGGEEGLSSGELAAPCSVDLSAAAATAGGVGSVAGDLMSGVGKGFTGGCDPVFVDDGSTLDPAGTLRSLEAPEAPESLRG
jgi:hypothetical protein